MSCLVVPGKSWKYLDFDIPFAGNGHIYINNLDHFVDGAKVYFYRPPSVLDVEKKTRKAKHIDHYVGPATIIKKIGSRSFQISYLNPATGLTQLLQRDAGMIILKKEWIAPSLILLILGWNQQDIGKGWNCA